MSRDSVAILGGLGVRDKESKKHSNSEEGEIMHARAVVVQVQPGKMEEAIWIYRDCVVPVAKQQDGFKNSFLLTDTNTGKGISITLWETQANMAAGESSGYYQEQIAKFTPTFATPSVMEHYEVSVLV